MTGDERLENLKENYDWRCAFNEAILHEYLESVGDRGPCPIDDVAEILHAIEGREDDLDWLGIFRMNDGRFLLLEAGCCYTGWDVMATGVAEYHDTLAAAIADLTPAQKARLKL